jgi:predicted PurR-regulated permease PerM
MLLLYLNYLMIGPYISSVFWAAIIAILLRGPRDWCVAKLGRFKAVEVPAMAEAVLPSSGGGGASLLAPAAPSDHALATLVQSLKTPLRKLVLLSAYVVSPCVATRRRQMAVAAGVSLWALFLVQSLMTGSLWWFLGLSFPLGLALFSAALLVLVPVNTLVAVLLVSSLVIVSMATGGVFVAQVVSESAEFAYGIMYRVHEVLGDDATLDQSRATLQHLLQVVKSGDGGPAQRSPTRTALGAAGPDSSVDRIISIASLLYTTNRNDTKGFRNAVVGLQSILKFEDELLEKLVALDYRDALWHPIRTASLLVSNSSMVLSAFWKTLMAFWAQIATMLLAFSVGFVNYAFSGVLFLASLFYMVQSDVAIVDRFTDVLPVAGGKALYRRVIMNYIRGIFLASFWSFVLTAVCTGVVFAVFGIQQFLYTSMLVAGLCAMFPIVPVWLVFLPPAINFFYWEGLLLWPAIFMSAGFALSWVLAPMVYMLVPYSHPYVTGLSLVLGLYTYGFEGILLGPLIVCLTLIILSILSGEAAEDRKVA